MSHTVNGSCDAVVVGAGFAGLYMLHRLRQAGFNARVLEAGSGVGGTWYWNRYPGARCDIESMEYSLQLLERVAAGVEVDGTLRRPAGDPALRRTRRRPVRSLARHHIRHTYRQGGIDEAASRWRIDTDTGESVGAMALIMATGCLSSANLPEFEGRTRFWRDLPHRPLAPRWRRLCRQAGGGHRYGLLGHSGDPRHRRRSGTPDRLPAYGQLLDPGAQRTHRSRLRA